MGAGSQRPAACVGGLSDAMYYLSWLVYGGMQAIVVAGLVVLPFVSVCLFVV
jgi:hypothetical protein